MKAPLTTRNATLGDLAALLEQQNSAKVDVVVPLADVTSHAANIVVKGTSVFGEGSTYRPTAIADAHLAEKLGIPYSYLKRLRAERADLFDANVNGWTQGAWDDEADQRNVMLRTFSPADVDDEGVLRAVLSDRYEIIDNLDVLYSALEGINDSGANVAVLGADLTETRMTVRLAAPDLTVSARELLAGYRSPFGGDGGVYDHSGGSSTFVRRGEVPEWAQQKFGVDPFGVSAGLVITNSETGGGAFAITPRLLVLVCMNGAMLNKYALRQVHLGGRLDTGIVAWSGDTQRKALALIAAQARDAVATFLTPGFLETAVGDLTERAGKAIAEPTKTLEVVAKQLAYTQEQREGILAHFIAGGQLTAGGVFQAVTSYAQTVEDAEAAFDLEASAFDALVLAGR